MREIFWMQGVR